MPAPMVFCAPETVMLTVTPAVAAAYAQWISAGDVRGAHSQEPAHATMLKLNVPPEALRSRTLGRATARIPKANGMTSLGK